MLLRRGERSFLYCFKLLDSIRWWDSILWSLLIGESLISADLRVPGRPLPPLQPGHKTFLLREFSLQYLRDTRHKTVAAFNWSKLYGRDSVAGASPSCRRHSHAQVDVGPGVRTRQPPLDTSVAGLTRVRQATRSEGNMIRSRDYHFPRLNRIPARRAEGHFDMYSRRTPLSTLGSKGRPISRDGVL